MTYSHIYIYIYHFILSGREEKRRESKSVEKTHKTCFFSITLPNIQHVKVARLDSCLKVKLRKGKKGRHQWKETAKELHELTQQQRSSK